MEVFLQKNLLWNLIIQILVFKLAFVDEMVVEGGDFYNLFTLPTRHQHWTLSPVVNIYWVLIKVFIISATEVANLLIFFIFCCAQIFLMGKARRLLISLSGIILVESIIGGLKLRSLPVVVIISMDWSSTRGNQLLTRLMSWSLLSLVLRWSTLCS